MKPQTIQKSVCQKGFSLLELLLVLTIITAVTLLTFSRLYSTSGEVGGGERILETVTGRIKERQSEAVRLNGNDHRRLSANSNPDGRIVPLPLDFTRWAETAALRTDGTDQDFDCRDDFTNELLTCLSSDEKWDLAFQSDALSLPEGWRFVQSESEFQDFSPIGGGSLGRGIPAVAVAFLPDGRAFGREINSEDWSEYPRDAIITDEPEPSLIPFWAVYFVLRDRRDTNQRLLAAVAVAVYPSGQIKEFRFDNGTWFDYRNRPVN